MGPFKKILALSLVFLLMGCLANLGDRDNVFDPNGILTMYEKGYPWTEYNYDDLDRMKLVVRFRTLAKFYYVLMPDGSAAPTKAAVKSGSVPGMITSGSIVIAQDAVTNETNVIVTGVYSNSSYSLYCVSSFKDTYDSGPLLIRVNQRYLGWFGYNGVITNWRPAPAVAGGSLGANDGMFNGPRAVEADWNGYIYVSDYGNHRIQKFSTNFAFIGWWGKGGVSGWHTTGVASTGAGALDNEFNQPVQLAIDRGNRVMYVADYANNRIQKYNLDNNLLIGWWGKDNLGDVGWHNPASGRTGASGGSDGMFNGPHGVAVDANGYVYVADYNNHRVQVFRSSGASVTFVTKIGLTGSAQSFTGFFNGPRGIASDGSYIYVSESGNQRIQKLNTRDWQYEWLWGGSGSGIGLLNTPMMLTFDRLNHLYVPDWGNHRIQKFSVTGKLMWVGGKIPAASGNTDGAFNNPGGVAADENGAIYIADSVNHRIQKYW